MTRLKLYNRDCTEVLPEIEKESVDLVLIDPPYLISKKQNTFSEINTSWNRKKAITNSFGDWDKVEQLDWDFLLKEFHRIMKDSATLIVFYDFWKLQELKENCEKYKFKQPRHIVWQKNNPVPIHSKKNYLNNPREYALTFVKKSKPTFNSEYDFGFYTGPICMGKERTKHPTQKPLFLIDQLVRKHSNPGDLVLDCFMGSGTTGVSCVNSDRRFVGVELERDYFKIATSRLKDAISNP
jgi:site-specific DNA-methyltransferase (adenine-specific)